MTGRDSSGWLAPVAMLLFIAACSTTPPTSLTALTPTDRKPQIPEPSETVQVAKGRDVTFTITDTALDGCFEATAFVEGFEPATFAACVPAAERHQLTWWHHDGCFHIVTPRADSRTLPPCDLRLDGARFGVLPPGADSVCFRDTIIPVTVGGAFMLAVPATTNSSLDVLVAMSGSSVVEPDRHDIETADRCEIAAGRDP